MPGSRWAFVAALLGAFLPSATNPAPASGALYWGAAVGAQFTGTPAPYDMGSTPNSVTDFSAQDAAGKGLSLVSFYEPWRAPANECGDTVDGVPNFCPLFAQELSYIRSYGAIPVLSWSSENTKNANDRSYTDAQIASDLASRSGATYDYVKGFADQAKAWSHPFFLRFDWEMNGNWFPWGINYYNGVTQSHQNAARDFTSLWKNVHRIFQQEGATNVTWVWCPNIDPAGGGEPNPGPYLYSPLSNLYPGDSYVDWTGLDGYNSGGDNADGQWQSFSQLVEPTYSTITGPLAPSKPLMIAETASTEGGGSKSQWITDLFTALPAQFPDVHAFAWFDVTPSSGSPTDWPIESSPSSQSAFTTAIGSSNYETNNYSAASSSPIPAP